jgi:hypothetical protein
MSCPVETRRPVDAAKKVASKSQQIVDVIKTKIEARNECYQRIRNIVYESYKRYYERHQDRAVDDRGADATEWSLNGLQSILNILGDYNITYRDGVNEVPLSIQVAEDDQNGATPSPVATTEPVNSPGDPQVS